MKLLAVTTAGLLAALASGCKYDATHNDCAISCTAATGCPNGFGCGSEGLCRVDGVSESCVSMLGDAGNDGINTDGSVDAPSVMFTPSNLGSVADDLHAGLQDVVLSSATINTDAGTITGVTLTGSETRIQFQTSAPEIEVFRLKSLRIQGAVSVQGARALAIVTVNDLIISGSITFTGITGCVSGTSGNGATGGGGGGFGANGANSGKGYMTTVVGTGASTRGAVSLIPLVHGCNGRGGNEFTSPSAPTEAANAGGGGGAIQLVAGTKIEISGSVCAAGLGGGGGQQIAASSYYKGGGGGGSGGGLLLEAPTVTVLSTGTIAANGGGGGSGGSAAAGVAGGFSCNPSSGGTGGDNPNANTGDGGAGGHGSVMAAVGTDADTTGPTGGGGGGGVGRIRINRADNGTPSGAVSPAPSLGTLLPP